MDAVAVAWVGPAGAWQVLKCPPFPFAMHPGFNLPVLVASQLSHGLVAIAWGALFGLLFANKRAATVLAAGPLWGLAVLIAMYYIVLPAFEMDGYVARANLLYSAVLHVGYGVGLGVGVASYSEHRRATEQRSRFRPARRDQLAEA
jgi:hypothetical protein